MFERVVVIGAGLAGLAAVHAAVPRGGEVRLVDPSFGSSALSGGAVDDVPWESVALACEALGLGPVARALPAEVEPFVQALGLWALPKEGEPLCQLATEAGRIRLARGRDRALLDLGRLPFGARLILPRVPRPEWEADLLARALREDPYARSQGLHIEAVDAKLLRFVGEDRISAADLAQRHDEPARREWLADRLQETVRAERNAGRSVDGILLGPWLGAAAPRAEELSDRVGMALGEILSGVGSAAGQRFEVARDRMLGALGLEREPRRALAVRRQDGELFVHTDEPPSPMTADRVVLAIGGLAGGGLRYCPAELEAQPDEPARARMAFGLSLEAPVGLRANGRRLEVVGSVHGPALDEDGWPGGTEPGLLESVGIAATGPLAAPGIYVAGDALADRPRTKLEAVRSGLRAGAAAAGEPGRIG